MLLRSILYLDICLTGVRCTMHEARRAVHYVALSELGVSVATA